MIPENIISQLATLELMAEECRQKAYSIRVDLERLSAPAPSGVESDSQKKISEILNKRRESYYKNQNKKQ